MLARAACAASSGPYQDFQLTEDDWEALHVAAWLHDCGKVTTPEYVVDKATKLEAIHDRIHEIRMRFEVLKRDAEISGLQAIVAGTDAESVHRRVAAELQRLDDDFAFVASCNEGGEFMAPESIDRLRSIATRTWLRTLDDRIGISREEKLRKARSPLPETARCRSTARRQAGARFCKAAAGSHAGEQPLGISHAGSGAAVQPRRTLQPLCRARHLVGRGALQDQRAYRADAGHAFATAFPEAPPASAGNRRSSPRENGWQRLPAPQLRREQMSPLARMMAIADIFEALTAVDRPYKKGKTLSEALAIMSRMQQEQHIDPDLFALFLRAGVHLDYAREFMQPGAGRRDRRRALARHDASPATRSLTRHSIRSGAAPSLPDQRARPGVTSSTAAFATDCQNFLPLR
jgi:hypothetical protein